MSASIKRQDVDAVYQTVKTIGKGSYGVVDLVGCLRVPHDIRCHRCCGCVGTVNADFGGMLTAAGASQGDKQVVRDEEDSYRA